MGFATGNHLAPHVHPNLTQSAALTCKGVDAFGAAVEAVLIKHGELILVYCTLYSVFCLCYVVIWSPTAKTWNELMRSELNSKV